MGREERRGAKRLSPMELRRCWGFGAVKKREGRGG
jgi:hypothetical protein